MKRLPAVLFFVFCVSLVLSYSQCLASNCDDSSRKQSRYCYVYMNPPRQSLDAWGVYLVSNSNVRYVHSPSKLKRQAHEDRINAYNYQMANY